jgi:membrane associated rhomboid family serine protease
MNTSRGLDVAGTNSAARSRTATAVVSTLRRCPVSCAIACLALSLYAIQPLGFELSALELSAGAMASGRWWTMFTGHLLHLSPTHLIFCVAGLLVAGYVFEPLFGRSYATITAAVAVAVGLAFVIAHAELSGYYGLSSLDQGLFVAVPWTHVAGGVAGLVIGAVVTASFDRRSLIAGKRRKHPQCITQSTNIVRADV